MHMREKVGKSRNTVFFPWFVGSGGSKSRLAKAAGAEPSGQDENAKLHAVVALSTFRSQNVQNTPCSDHVWKLRCRKSARHCGAKDISKSMLWREAHFEVKMLKTPHVRATFGSWDVEKVHAVVARTTFRSQKCQKIMGMEHFWTLRCRFAWQAQGIEQNVRVLSHVQKRWQASDIWRGSAKMHFVCQAQYKRHVHQRDVKRSGRWFPERGCILEHQICRFAKMILRDRCSTSYHLASIFRGRRSTLDRWTGKNRKTHWYAAVRNCFVFDVVKFKNWRSLAELLRFDRDIDK